MDIKILVATHKSYWMPDDEMYIPIQVGSAVSDKDLGFVRDDSGDNISGKNKNYCELTGLYWAWKNLEADYLGLVHYRRHFVLKRKNDKQSSVLSKDELAGLLKKYDVILPRKRQYYIETTYNHYVHAHHKEDLDITLDIIKEKYSDYVNAFNDVMSKTGGHRFNMFIMKKELFDDYCEWIFSILFELEKRLDISEYSVNDARVFGFVSERLLDVWINANNIQYKEIPYIFMEKQNWIKKGSSFLKRKFQHG